MEFDHEYTFTGVFIGIACFMSVVLFYLFKRSALIPRSSVDSIKHLVTQKKKKGDVKKVKKNKKVRLAPVVSHFEKTESEKLEFSDVDTYDLIKKENYGCESDEEVLVKFTPAGIDDDCLKEMCDENLKSEKDNDCYFTEPNLPQLSVPEQITVCSSSPQEISGLKNTSEETKFAVFESNKSKKSKRRTLKKNLKDTNSQKIESLDDGSSLETQSEIGFVDAPVLNQKVKSNENQLLTDSNVYNEILSELGTNKNKLLQASQEIEHLKLVNNRLRSKEEETTLSLQVLQEQYTELLRANKSFEHQKKLINIKLQNVESEKCELTKRLEQLNAEHLKVKKEADLELNTLREHLSENKSKMTAMAAALSAPPPPSADLSSELYHAQELAKAMSNDNCLLKSRFEQLETELSQLRQANLRQQQELQVFRVENRKLHTEKENALDELRIKLQAEQTETNNRLVSYEAQLNHRCHELEFEKKRNQEYLQKLSETTSELSRLMEREKHQTEIISSLEYQFAELNTEKQNLFEQATQSKLTKDACISEFHAQIITLTRNLAQATTERDEFAQKCADLSQELEQSKPLVDATLNSKPFVASEDAATVTEDEDGGKCESEPNLEFVRNLQIGLDQKECELDSLRNRMEENERLYKDSVNQTEYYKAALMQTEDLLAKLEDHSRSEENKWQRLLANNEQKLKSEIEQLKAVLCDKSSVVADEMQTSNSNKCNNLENQKNHKNNSNKKKNKNTTSLNGEEILDNADCAKHSNSISLKDLTDSDVDDESDVILVENSDFSNAK